MYSVGNLRPLFMGISKPSNTEAIEIIAVV